MKYLYGMLAALPLLFAVQTASAVEKVPNPNDPLLNNPSQQRMQQQQQNQRMVSITFRRKK